MFLTSLFFACMGQVVKREPCTNCTQPGLQRYDKHHSANTRLLMQGGAAGLKERGCLGAQEKSIACQVQARAVISEETCSHLCLELSVFPPRCPPSWCKEARCPAHSCLQDLCQSAEEPEDHTSHRMSEQTTVFTCCVDASEKPRGISLHSQVLPSPYILYEPAFQVIFS